VSRAFAIAFQRDPSPEELASCRRFLEEQSLPELCRALMNTNEFVYIR
jgi:hypothetical protein